MNEATNCVCKTLFSREWAMGLTLAILSPPVFAFCLKVVSPHKKEKGGKVLARGLPLSACGTADPGSSMGSHKEASRKTYK